MKSLILAFGLFALTGVATAAEENDSGNDEFSDLRSEGVLYGSCDFQGQFASGCTEFTDGTWTDASILEYCQKSSKAGSNPVVEKTNCNKADYNASCVVTAADGSVASTYVNNMPSFICKKYQGGELIKRPATGW